LCADPSLFILGRASALSPGPQWVFPRSCLQLGLGSTGTVVKNAGLGKAPDSTPIVRTKIACTGDEFKLEQVGWERCRKLVFASSALKKEPSTPQTHIHGPSQPLAHVWLHPGVHPHLQCPFEAATSTCTHEEDLGLQCFGEAVVDDVLPTVGEVLLGVGLRRGMSSKHHLARSPMPVACSHSAACERGKPQREARPSGGAIPRSVG